MEVKAASRIRAAGDAVEPEVNPLVEESAPQWFGMFKPMLKLMRGKEQPYKVIRVEDGMVVVRQKGGLYADPTILTKLTSLCRRNGMALIFSAATNQYVDLYIGSEEALEQVIGAEV